MVPARARIPTRVRRELAERAGHRCSYCRSPALAGVPMVVDHIIPLVAGGASQLENLCLACYRCSTFKAARTEGVDPQSGITVPLFNPNLDHWQAHFAWNNDGSEMVGLSAVGRATIATLHLNEVWSITARRCWAMAEIHPPVE